MNVAHEKVSAHSAKAFFMPYLERALGRPEEKEEDRKKSLDAAFEERIDQEGF